jgi:hypothetical protein
MRLPRGAIFAVAAAAVGGYALGRRGSSRAQLDAKRFVPYSKVMVQASGIGQTNASKHAEEKILSRIEGSFREVYLTLVSIIQGVALGYLAQTMGDAYQQYSANQWARVVAAFLIIIVIWQEYMVGATVFAWVPTMLDSIGPFLLGVGEFLAIAAISRPLSWFLLFFSMIFGVGTVACLNYLYHTSRDSARVNRFSREFLNVHPKSQYKICVGCFLWTLILLVLSLAGLPPAADTIIGSLSVVPSLFFFASLAFRWNRPVNRMLTKRGVSTDLDP